MLGRRRVFAVVQLGNQDGPCENLAQSCVVPGITSTYRRIPEEAHGCSLDSQEGDSEPRGLERQVTLRKLASQDSGVEIAVGDSPLATLPGLSQDSLDLEPPRTPESPPAQLDRLLANCPLEQGLQQSQEFPGFSGQQSSLQPPSKPQHGVPHLAAEEEPTEIETELEASEEEVAAMDGTQSGACTCLPGQGLQYLEHLCLVLEQMAKLQQLYLQLQPQRPPGVDLEEESALAPSPSRTPDTGVQRSRKWLKQTKETGSETASLPEVEMFSTKPPRLSEALEEATCIFPSTQGHKDLSHWDKLKVLVNRIRWRNPRHPASPVPPDGSGPRMEPRNLYERPQCRPHRKTGIPSKVVKKPRTKNLSV